jgi:hypothetical protein
MHNGRREINTPLHGISFRGLSIGRCSGYFSEYPNQNNVNTLSSLTTASLFSANGLIRISIPVFRQRIQFSSSFNLLSLVGQWHYSVALYQGNIHCKIYTRGPSCLVFNLTSQHAYKPNALPQSSCLANS